MTAMDLTRFAAVLSVPAAYALGWLGFAQLLAVSVITAAAGVAFKAANGFAFGMPCIGGLVGARLSRPLVARFGQQRVVRAAGALRACWSLGLAFILPGTAGIALVILLQLGLVTCVGVFNPVFAAYRLEQTATDRVARTLAAWSITSSATIAAMTAPQGLLAGLAGPRAAIAVAGLLLLATPLLLPRIKWGPLPQQELAPTGT